MSPPPNTPPPPYSPAGANAQWTIHHGPLVKTPAVASIPTNTWTRFFECQTDTSRISMNYDGSWLYYSKGERAPAKPTAGDSPRKYFCTDGSKIVLSRDGWIEFDNGTGPRTSRLEWVIDATGKGWHARGPQPAPTSMPAYGPTSGRAPASHGRHDSGAGSTMVQHRWKQVDEYSEDEKDPYDPNKKYGL